MLRRLAEEYAIVLARERGSKRETLLTALVTLPVIVVDRDDDAPGGPSAIYRSPSGR
jgi:hypothetical protein